MIFGSGAFIPRLLPKWTYRICVSQPSFVWIPTSEICVNFDRDPCRLNQVQVWRMRRPGHRSDSLLSEIVARDCREVSRHVIMHGQTSWIFLIGSYGVHKLGNNSLKITLCRYFPPLLFPGNTWACLRTSKRAPIYVRIICPHMAGSAGTFELFNSLSQV